MLRLIAIWLNEIFWFRVVGELSSPFFVVKLIWFGLRTAVNAIFN